MFFPERRDLLQGRAIVSLRLVLDDEERGSAKDGSRSRDVELVQEEQNWISSFLLGSSTRCRLRPWNSDARNVSGQPGMVIEHNLSMWNRISMHRFHLLPGPWNEGEGNGRNVPRLLWLLVRERSAGFISKCTSDGIEERPGRTRVTRSENSKLHNDNREA